MTNNVTLADLTPDDLGVLKGICNAPAFGVLTSAAVDQSQRLIDLGLVGIGPDGRLKETPAGRALFEAWLKA